MFNYDYLKFTTSISSDSYLTKEEATTAFTKSATSPMAWQTVSVTMDEMLRYCITGHSYCNLFHNKKGDVYTRPFNSWNKTNDNFAGSYVVTVDVDEFGELTLDYDYKISRYINILSENGIEPSFWYTSFSHNPSEQKLKVHLIYVFDSIIPGKDGGETYRMLAEKICERVEIAGGVSVDERSKVCSQFFNPTNLNNSSLTVEYGISRHLYQFTDFGIDDIDSIWAENVKSFVPRSTPITVGETLLREYDLLPKDLFFEKYGSRYRYYYRKELGYEWYETESGCRYADIDDEYFALYYNARTLKDGMGRRKKIYERMCERRIMNPTATPNEIAYCAMRDTELFVDNSDRVFDTDYFRRNVNHCFKFSVDELKQQYSHNIAKLKSRKPKRNFIVQYAYGMTSGQKAKIRSDIFADKVFSVYDVSMSPSENIEILNTLHNISISTSTLYTYFSTHGFNYSEYKTMKQEKKEQEVLLCLEEMFKNNMSITVKSVRNRLRESGIKISNDSCSRIIKDFKSNRLYS